MIPGNPYSERAEMVPDIGDAQVFATLALAYEQHQRNRLAAHTAVKRGLPLPDDLAALAGKE